MEARAENNREVAGLCGRSAEALSEFLRQGSPQPLDVEADRCLLKSFYNTPCELLVPWASSHQDFCWLMTELACADAATLHCLLAMTAAFLKAQGREDSVVRRGEWHFSRALRLTMQDDRTNGHSCNSGGEAEQAVVARALLFCLRSEILGETYASSPAYRIHWNAISHIVFQCSCRLPSQQLEQLLTNLVKFHGLIHILISLPAEQWMSGEAYAGLRMNHNKTEWASLERLSTTLAQVNALRCVIRQKIASGETINFEDNLDMMQLEYQLRTYSHSESAAQHSLQMVYGTCARVYMLRTMLAPRQHPQLRQCTDSSLDLIEAEMRSGCSVLVLLLLPLYLTACAAFDLRQRARVMGVYRQMDANAEVKARIAREGAVLAELWRLMDNEDPANWDFEKVASDRMRR